jgi:hypothetical protein
MKAATPTTDGPFRHGLVGSSTTNVVVGVSARRMVPWCRWTMSHVIASPSAVPPESRVRASSSGATRSKISVRLSAGMPTPSSLTVSLQPMASSTGHGDSGSVDVVGCWPVEAAARDDVDAEHWRSMAIPTVHVCVSTVSRLPGRFSADRIGPLGGGRRCRAEGVCGGRASTRTRAPWRLSSARRATRQRSHRRTGSVRSSPENRMEQCLTRQVPASRG